MGNPYAPRRARTAGQAVTEKAQFLRRLRLLGYDDDQVREVSEHWDDFDETYTPEDRRALVRSSDAQLQAMLREINAEYIEGTRTPAEQTLEERAARVATAETEAADLMSEPVAKLIEWVGSDQARAMAVANLERDNATPRKTLLAAMDALILGT